MPPRPILGRLLIGLAAMAPPLAAADTLAAPAGSHWRCWYDRAQHVACLLERAGPHLQPDSRPAAAGSARQLPPIVVELRERPTLWRGRLVRIPLHTEPMDGDLTAQLAQAVLCGRLAGCRVDYHGLEPVFSLQAMADLADREDWLLQAAE